MLKSVDLDLPSSFSDKQDGEGKVAESLELSCTLEGYPRPAVTWMFQGVELNQDTTKFEITEDYTKDTVCSYLLKNRFSRNYGAVNSRVGNNLYLTFRH